MTDILIQSFTSTFFSMLKIFFIVLAAGVLVRKKVLSQENLHGLSVATVDVFLPCMSFTSILANFRPGQFDIWWVLPTAGILITVAGILMGWLFFFGELPEKRNMVPLCGVQNAGYLILPLGAVLFPDQFDQFSVYCFLFIMGQSLTVWTVGKQMTTASPEAPMRWQSMLTPPLIATLLAIVFVAMGIHPIFFLPEDGSGAGPVNTLLATAFDAAEFIGQATVPLAIFILGGVLGSITFKFRAYMWDVIRVVTVKLFLLPLLILVLVYFWGIGETLPLLAVFFVIESSSAPAIATVLQVKKYGGDEQKIGTVILVCYLACLLMMPFWVGIWSLISQG